MSNSPAHLQLTPFAPRSSSPAWRRKAPQIVGALVVHLAPLALLWNALPLKPIDLGGAFGQSISVTLVSSAPSSAPAPSETRTSAQPALARMEQRLSAQAPDSAPVSQDSKSAQPTNLSDLFDPQDGGPSKAAAKGPPSPVLGADDDPFARASVSYRGDDPEKAARLQSKARRCARAAKSTRLLLIINSEGYLVARPRLLGAKNEDRTLAKVIAAVEACGPFSDAATPGPPRSYEIDVG